MELRDEWGTVSLSSQPFYKRRRVVAIEILNNPLGCGFLKGCGVDLPGYFAELFVGSLFFRQRFVEQLGNFVLAQELCILADATVAGHFVVLHPLSSRDEGGVAHG